VYSIWPDELDGFIVPGAMAPRIIRTSDLADAIITRLNIYAAGLQADMRAFRTQHGEGAVTEALQLIEQRGRVTADHWDERGHARAVKVGLMKAVDDHRKAEADDPLGDALPGSWR
jgi:hypothetical protein